MRAHGVPGFPDPSGGQFNLTGINQDSQAFRQAVALCAPAAQSAGPSPRAQAQAQAQALAFSRCMRAHGLPGFSDPVPSDGGFVAHSSSSGGLDPDSPVFQAALRTCRPVLGGGESGGGGTG